jgi:ADP-heptose:LPS heptosyltransferase
MKIALRYEGGVGDCFCANRFVPAIKDKYPDAEIHAFLDTEGNKMQESALRMFYPHFYQGIKTIPSKKYKPFIIKSQFCVEDNYAAFENIPDEFQKEMLSYDKFYDLHIDGMKWINYDFNWRSHFYYFPKPSLTFEDKENCLPPNFIVCQLLSGSATNKNINEIWYAKRLVTELAKHATCLLVSSPETEHYISHFRGMGNDNIIFLSGGFEFIAYAISKASLFIGIDSALKYIAYGCGVPSIVYTNQSYSPHSVTSGHKLRWLPFAEDCFPLNYDYLNVVNYANRILANPACSITPFVNNFKQENVIREYLVDLDKSKLIL